MTKPQHLTEMVAHFEPGAPDDMHRAFYAADAWAERNNFDTGPSQRGAPIGLMLGRGRWLISKWRGLTARERTQLDGAIITTPSGAKEVWVRP